MSFSDTAVPLYLQIADLMRRRIARGLWKHGEKLPSLEALMAEFGVARVTVRQAVDLLAREGLVSPQRGKGTFVTGTPPQRRWQREWQTVHASVDALAQAFQDTRPRIVTINESLSEAPLHADDGTPAERYVYMRRVHSEHDEPYCVIEIYLDEAIFRTAPERYRSEAVIPLLAQRGQGGIAQARQVLTIGNADMDVARLLNMHVGDAVAEVRRVFTDRDRRVIYLAHVTYRGELFRLEMDLAPPQRP
ncbi:GntR family transcriptional regulator [Comamonas humi]